jgi:hypothetical protein
MPEKKTENIAKYQKSYYKKQKENQRALIEQYNKDKWRTYLTNVEYMLWCINTKKTDEVKSV